MKRKTCQLHYSNCKAFYPMLFIFSSSFSIPFSYTRPCSFPTHCFQTSDLSCQSQPNQLDSLLPSQLIYSVPNNWLIHPFSFPSMTAMYRSPPHTWGGIMSCSDNPHLPRFPNFLIRIHHHPLRSWSTRTRISQRLRFFPFTTTVFCQSLFRNADLSFKTRLAKVPGKKRKSAKTATLIKHQAGKASPNAKLSAYQEPPQYFLSPSCSEDEVHCMG